jgi:hypothetical protein
MCCRASDGACLLTRGCNCSPTNVRLSARSRDERVAAARAVPAAAPGPARSAGAGCSPPRRNDPRDRNGSTSRVTYLEVWPGTLMGDGGRAAAA